MAQPLSSSALDDLTPVHRLAKDDRARLAQSGQVSAIGAGKKILSVQEHAWLDYLLAGKLCLIDGAKKVVIEAGSLRACHPIFTEDRLHEQAVLLSDGQLLRLDRQLYESLRGEPPASTSDDLDALGLTEAEGALLASFYRECKEGKLALPSLPKVARAIQDALSDPNITSARLARLVQMDLAVTGGLIRLANSVMYRGSRPILDVRKAIIRLGMDTTRSVVLSMAMQQIFKSKSPLIKHRMKAAWNRSVHISALSYVIAKHCEGFQPEQAMLAGLVHDVGVVPILDYVTRQHREIHEGELEAAIIKLRIMVGELVVSYWGLGPEIVQVVRESGRWYRDAGDSPDYCDIVLLARLHRMSQSESRGPLPRYDEVPAYFKLGLGLPDQDEGQVDVIAEAGEELAEVISMLRGVRG